MEFNPLKPLRGHWFLAVIILGAAAAGALLLTQGGAHKVKSLRSSPKPQILLLGVDGASWSVIAPLLRVGRLPNIKALMAQGCYGDIIAPFSLHSPVIWTSIITGKLP